MALITHLKLHQRRVRLPDAWKTQCIIASHLPHCLPGRPHPRQPGWPPRWLSCSLCCCWEGVMTQCRLHQHLGGAVRPAVRL